MHVLPIAFSPSLFAKCDLAAFELKQAFDGALPEWLKTTFSGRTARVIATIVLDDCDQLKGLEISMQNAPSEMPGKCYNFPCNISVDSYNQARIDLVKAIMSGWAQIGVEKRAARGRELLELEDDQLEQLISDTRYEAPSTYSYYESMRFFLHHLAIKEKELREAVLSNHQMLQQKKLLKELQTLSGEEMIAAEQWWNSTAECDRPRIQCYHTRKLAKNGQILFAYREHFMDHTGSFASHNHWGEPVESSSRGAEMNNCQDENLHIMI